MAALWYILVVALISSPAGLAQDATEMPTTELPMEQTTTADMTTHDLLATTKGSTTTPQIPTTIPTTQMPTTSTVPTMQVPTTIRVTTPVPCPSGCTCDRPRRTAQCDQLSSETIPTFPSYITTLTLTGNTLTRLQEGLFDGLTDLIQLYLVSCEIQEIEAGAFRDLGHLRVLHLRYNQILSLGGNLADEQSVFVGLEELEELDLRNNDLGTLADNSFEPLVNLKMLHLDDNQISNLQDGLFEYNTKLAKLSLKNLDLTAIPSDVFQNTPELQQLELSGNNIDEIPSAAFSTMPNLKELVLSTMSINSLDNDAFSGLANLETLDLSNNDIDTIVKEVVEPLGSLTTLILSLNEWNCNCQLFKFVDYIKATGINYYASPWNCATPNRLTGERVYLVPEREFACVPYIRKSVSQTKTVDYDQHTYFECVADGDPTPLIEWTKPNGDVVTATSNIENVYTMLHSSVVIIQHAKGEDNGDFVCMATNSNGQDTAEFQLIVENIPTTAAPPTTRGATSPSIPCPNRAIEEPISVRAINIKDTSAELNWVEYKHPRAKGYVIEITEFASQDPPITVLIQSVANVSYTVDNLILDTNYILCVDVWIPDCPSPILYEQCVQLSTQGGTNELAALRAKHTNEIIGTVISVFFGTLLILASIFVILWQYRKPKTITRYELDKREKALLDDDVETGMEIDEGSSNGLKPSRITQRTPSARFTPPSGHTNPGLTDDENKNIYTVEVHGQNGIKPTSNGIKEKETKLDGGNDFNDLEDIKEEEEKGEPTYDKVPEEDIEDPYQNDETLQMSRLSTVGLVQNDDEGTDF